MPTVFLAAISAAYGLGLLVPSAASSIVLQMLAVAIALSVAMVLLRRGIKAAGGPPALPEARYQIRAWMIRALPLVLMGSMFLVNSNADILMLGALAGPGDAGLYKAASRGAELVTFGLLAVSVPLGPAVARMYAAGDSKLLQRTVTRWARLAFVPAASLAAGFILWGQSFLALFGPDFVTDKARTTLAILSAGQLFNVAAGPVGLLLIMTKKERMAAVGVTLAAGINIAMNAVLIPLYGLEGAAVATVISMVAWNLMLVFFVRAHLHINPAVLPLWAPHRGG
jgi:O-antigen/teichoic acid export membrane protein